MGLDQYIFQEVENEYEEDGKTKVNEIHYWRKNYQLNEWACDNWCPETMANFNCERLPLYDFMIEDIIKHILYNLDKGSSDEEGYEGICSGHTLEVFHDCLERVRNGKVLYYYAWW